MFSRARAASPPETRPTRAVPGKNYGTELEIWSVSVRGSTVG